MPYKEDMPIKLDDGKKKQAAPGTACFISLFFLPRSGLVQQTLYGFKLLQLFILMLGFFENDTISTFEIFSGT